MQRRGAEAHDDAAKGAHLERRDAKDARRRAVHELLHAAGEVDHGRDGGMHNEKRHARGESRDLLLGARHADRHADGKDEWQVVKDDAAARREHRENIPGDGAGPHDAKQVVRGKGGLVGKRAAEAHEQARHRQHRDGEHERAPHALKDPKDLVLHIRLLASEHPCGCRYSRGDPGRYVADFWGGTRCIACGTMQSAGMKKAPTHDSRTTCVPPQSRRLVPAYQLHTLHMRLQCIMPICFASEKRRTANGRNPKASGSRVQRSAGLVRLMQRRSSAHDATLTQTCYPWTICSGPKGGLV